MAAGRLRAVVATSSLDLGIDWGGVDQVLQVGAPKGVSAGCCNVSAAPTTAWTNPRARFSCPRTASRCWNARRRFSASPRANWTAIRRGRAASTCSRSTSSAPPAARRSRPTRSTPRCAAPRPTRPSPRADFDDVLRFVEDGGYALAAYERYRKLFRDAEGRVHVRGERVARQHRMNIGTIVEEPLLKVRLGRARAGCSARWRSISPTCSPPATPSCSPAACCASCACARRRCEAEEGGDGEPKVPAYAGGRMPMTTNLADRVRAMLQAPRPGARFPSRCRSGCACRRAVSRLPGRHDLLVETFPRGDRLSSSPTASRAATRTRRSACC